MNCVLKGAYNTPLQQLGTNSYKEKRLLLPVLEGLGEHVYLGADTQVLPGNGYIAPST